MTLRRVSGTRGCAARGGTRSTGVISPVLFPPPLSLSLSHSRLLSEVPLGRLWEPTGNRGGRSQGGGTRSGAILPANRTCWKRGSGRGLLHVTLSGLLIRRALLAGVLVLCRRLCAQACRPRNCAKVTTARRLSIHHPSIQLLSHPSSVCLS